MSQPTKIKVYVSYSRHEEEQSNTISGMQSTLQDIDFQIDTEQVKYRDDFMDYIARIGRADYIVVVFSEEYLKSFYCMYKLANIMLAKGNLKQRVFPIRSENFDLNDKSKQTEIRRYWKQVIDEVDATRFEGLCKQGSIEELKEIQSQLDAIFNQFSTTHAPTAEELAPTLTSLFDNSYQAIREWLKEAKPEALLAGKKQISDEKFIFKVEKEITRILKRFPVLYANLREEFENIADERELAKILCTNKDQEDLLADILLVSCQEAVRSFKQKESNDNMQALKSDIRKLLNCLCVMAINPDWLIKQNASQEKILLIPVATSLGEVATAGRVGQVISNMSAAAEILESRTHRVLSLGALADIASRLLVFAWFLGE